ncbi:hypothetical protein KM1_320800 [Entamoeba histolytica HM-3:IMSS]|uniref:Mitochondrial carrier protein n=3 Tax=Entamoeba histolytica TaxID=5759 RepID=C4MAE5_ENTH1|nr:hypothetical protein EHI_172170 [Entamoeba histolytica HM-1:IMSS]EAL44551.1 hypothetical protein EHI_172170 [Entamoeba histolytica HM-1:IMSS]EMS14599.1 hypothetical protein KM1_320800 [Entamoeba histolytica HM-3:IMSS]GAT98763.1 hypothetical protein CL6EHI_172170 [Entamoeba histolytica]|eukprot:XP_649937.1 hypothetical protein EHI_172170 [Entamoeba histolytica HM-1:IMSS]
MFSQYLSYVGGTLTQFIIEKPITTPFQAALTCSQMNGLSTWSNMSFLARKNSLFKSLPYSILNAIPLTVSEQLAIRLLLTQKERKTHKISLCKQLAITSLSTITSFPFTYLEIVNRTHCCSDINLKDIKYAIPRPLNIPIIPLYWNILRNITYSTSHSFTSLKLQNIKCFSSNSLIKINAISSMVGTLLSYPFDVLLSRSIHNYSTGFSPSILTHGICTQLLINVSLSSAYGYLAEKYYEKHSLKRSVFRSIKSIFFASQ